MSRTEFMKQLESLLQNISATGREEALQYYNEYFNDAGPENEQNVIEALGNPAKVAENIKKDIFGNGYGDNIYQKINADNRAMITYPVDAAEGGRADRHMVRTDHRFRGNGSCSDTDSDCTGGCGDHQHGHESLSSLFGNGTDRSRTDLRRCRTFVPDADRGHGRNCHPGHLSWNRKIIPEKR